MKILLSIKQRLRANPIRVVKTSKANLRVKENDNPCRLAPTDYWDNRKFNSDAFVKKLQESIQETAKWLHEVKREMRTNAIKVSRMIIS